MDPRTKKITMTCFCLEEDTVDVKESLTEDWFGRHDCPMAVIMVEATDPTPEEDKLACDCMGEVDPVDPPHITPCIPAPRTWQNQFPPDFRPPDEFLTWLNGQDRFQDSSWGKEVSPSFTYAFKLMGDEVRIVLWVDHPDPDKREMQGPRYHLYIHPSACDHEQFYVLRTNDVQQAIAAAEWTVRMTRTVLLDIISMLTNREMPKTIASFADIHLYCDANTLGMFEEGCEYFNEKFGHLRCEEPGKEWDPCRDLFFQVVQSVQSLMGWWIQKGMP